MLRPTRLPLVVTVGIGVLVLLALVVVVRSRGDASRHDAVLRRVDECGIWKVRLDVSNAGDLWEADPQPEPVGSDKPAPKVVTGGSQTSAPPASLMQTQVGPIPRDWETRVQQGINGVLITPADGRATFEAEGTSLRMKRSQLCGFS